MITYNFHPVVVWAVHESLVYCTVVNIQRASIVSGYTYGVEPDFLNVNILCGCSIHCLTVQSLCQTSGVEPKAWTA